MKKLKYNIDSDGNIIACGYRDYSFEVDETTPFQSIEESVNWRKKDGIWERYDPTWTDEKFTVRVIIPAEIVVLNDDYLALKSHVLQLESEGNAIYEAADGKITMYFLRLLPEHEYLLKQDTNVIIEYNENL
jgi:hypothetical protein